jgi:hypothetical protein
MKDSFSQTIDDSVPVFNEWNDASEKILATNDTSSEDTLHDEDPTIEQSPTLSEAVKIVHR